MPPKLSRLLQSAAAWRAVDAFSPRLFALALHTGVIAAFGLAGYAVFAWVAGTFALCFALIPDPHSYLLVRAHGARALRLARLVTPVMLGKGIVVPLIAAGSAYLFLSDELKASVGSQLNAYILASLCYSLTEALWAYVGVLNLAADRLRKSAISGLGARTTGLLLVLFAYAQGLHHPVALTFIYCLPLFVAIAAFTPAKWRPRASIIVWHIGVRRYALWSQGIGLTSGWLSQVVPLVAGAIPAITPAELGVVAYATRVMGAAIAPLQVLQSIIIKQVALSKDASAPAVIRYDRLFKGITLALTALIVGGTLGSGWFYHLTPMVVVALLVQAYGLLIFCWYRVPLTACMTTAPRKIFMLGYLPATLVVALLAWPAATWGGLLGLTLLAAVAWTYISLSWKFPAVKNT